MGVGEFLILGFIAFGIYSLINKVIKLYEKKLNHEMSMELTVNKIDRDFKDIKDADFEDVYEDIKK